MATPVKKAPAAPQAPSNDQPSPETAARPAAPAPVKADRQWWFDARGLSDASILDVAYQSGCSAILLNPDQQEAIMTAKPKIVFVERADQLAKLAPDLWVLSPDEDVVAKARQAGRKAGIFYKVEDLDREFQRCRQLVARGYDFVLIDMHHPTYIPFELLLAETLAGTRLLRFVPIHGLQGTVDEVNQALNAFGTLEDGIDVVFQSRSVKDIKELDSTIEERLHGKMKLVEAEVIEVEHTGLGHRVCVDTTTLMTNEEGMIIGTTGWGGIFVCSETHYLPHMNLREFRCNAGSVQSYVWGPNNVAVYLSELRAGSRVLAVDIRGRTRVLTVGRVKIERRPLLLITTRVNVADLPETHIARKRPADYPSVLIKTFLQNDWHVRIMGADGKVRNSTLVKRGEKLLAFADEPGRHTGLKVSETIIEK
jgi:3-amino-4-hydroxybenzoic acid synthase